MKKTLLTIDAYLSDENRASTCISLINQLRKNLSNYEILLINKSGKSFGTENLVDYYINYNKSFLIGYPPDNFLNGKYSIPYVYVETSIGTCENWLPYTGVTDHVGGIYNSFVISANFGKTLGYEKIFKIEFDTFFDENELKIIEEDLKKEWDYLFFGKRKEGKWSKSSHYLIDVHICGYNVKLFDGFNIVKNDNDFWNLCDNIEYWGKWIEYVIPHILEYQQKNIKLNGIMYEENVRNMFPNTKFDTINGVGGWTEKWKNIPKVCRLSNDGVEEKYNEFCLFYWNDEENVLEVNTKIYEDNILIHEKSINLNTRHYVIDKFELNKELKIEKTNIRNGVKEVFVETITPLNIKKFNTRFLSK